MYFVYVLQSHVRQWFYVGLTANIVKRVEQHNNGRTQSTKAYKPFKLIYCKQFATREEARDYEKYLKIRANKEKLLLKLQYI